MSCLPCDSAVEYSCTDEDCFWDYTDGLNPGNPRSAANEEKRPSWLDGWDLGTGHYFPRIYPGVKDRWDWREENE